MSRVVSINYIQKHLSLIEHVLYKRVYDLWCLSLEWVSILHISHEPSNYISPSLKLSRKLDIFYVSLWIPCLFLTPKQCNNLFCIIFLREIDFLQGTFWSGDVGIFCFFFLSFFFLCMAASRTCWFYTVNTR